MAEELIVNYVKKKKIKTKSAASQEENNNWLEATTGVLFDNYWKSMKVDISTLESISAWELLDWYKSMNAIDLT